MVNNRQKVLVAMSGGVDSSVAAALVKERGYEVTGVTMRIWDGEDLPGEGKHHGCYGPGEYEDIADASEVAKRLGIPFQVIDLTKEYKAEVLDYFCQEYLSGRTPNPCIRCNRRMKFGTMIEKARERGIEFEYVASGHYAQVEYNADTNRYLLKKAVDLRKDQSYFLAFLSQEQLRRMMFPLGDRTKAEVREMAQSLGLSVAEKPESQNFVCGDYSSIIKAETRPGPIMDKGGNILGQHRGIQFYTIGQRKGLGVATKDILYVTALDSQRNAVLVGGRDDIYRDQCVVSNLNWIAVEEINQPVKLKVKIRSSHKEAEAVINPVDKENIQVQFKEAQMAITPGQAAVLYDEETVVGGGIITRV